MKKRTKWLTCAALCLMLPACGMAVTEGVVEEAPMVEMDGISAPAAEISYMPDASYYEGYGDWIPAWEESSVWVESRYDGECYHDVEQRPRMTAGEAARARALLADYQAGTITYEGESVLNKLENVIVGVYALNPADYDGEEAFVILPGPCMTDEQLLAIIAAYDEMGLVFDPDALDYRSCARGGGIETNRFFSEEERERYQDMASMIRRGVLDVSGKSLALSLNPKLDSRYFCGLPDFTIRPYRRMTDDELISALLNMHVEDESDKISFDDTERRSRKALNEGMGCPPSMKLSQIYTEGSSVPQVFDPQCRTAWVGEARMGYGADFTYYTDDGILVYAHTMFDKETGELINASAMHSRDSGDDVWPPEGGPVTNEAIVAAVSEAERITGCSGLTWHALTDDMTWTNWGECLPVRAQLTDDLWMTLYIGTDDGKLHGMEIKRGTLVEQLPQDDMPVNG